MAPIIRSYIGRYTIHAYVCSGGCTRIPDVQGTVPFEQIYTKRPDSCRYAVVGTWSMEKHAEVYAVLDLYEARTKGKTMRVVEPPPRMICEDLDQAIAATMLLYEGES
jgi:hypothetical protein